ncbi:hypothetical protein CC79DRAFT_1336439 [Sarocladium strictum]
MQTGSCRVDCIVIGHKFLNILVEEDLVICQCVVDVLMYEMQKAVGERIQPTLGVGGQRGTTHRRQTSFRRLPMRVVHSARDQLSRGYIMLSFILTLIQAPLAHTKRMLCAPLLVESFTDTGSCQQGIVSHLVYDSCLVSDDNRAEHPLRARWLRRFWDFRRARLAASESGGWTVKFMPMILMDIPKGDVVFVK